MRIGILTFHKAHNFGAVLQCYATQEALKSMGFTVEVIDYQPKYLISPYKIFNIKRFKTKKPLLLVRRIIVEILLLKDRIARYNNFERFINDRLQLSKPIIGNNIPSNYDAYVLGSDQIWNPIITNGFDKVFFGAFPKDSPDTPVISYAASMETTSLNEADKKYYTSALNNFTAISVRESQLAELLAPITPKPIECVLDPSLLVSRSIWDKLCTPNQYGKYILIYQVRRTNNIYRIAHQIAKERNCKVIEIPAFLQYKRKSKRQAEEYKEYAPEQFISMIRNAECIVTSSFHGTSFSIIFNKPFYTIEIGDNADTRSKSLLTSLNLLERMIPQDGNITFTPIDFTEANQKLNSLRISSMEFLKKSLKGGAPNVKR